MSLGERASVVMAATELAADAVTKALEAVAERHNNHPRASAMTMNPLHIEEGSGDSTSERVSRSMSVQELKSTLRSAPVWLEVLAVMTVLAALETSEPRLLAVLGLSAATLAGAAIFAHVGAVGVIVLVLAALVLVIATLRMVPRIHGMERHVMQIESADEQFGLDETLPDAHRGPRDRADELRHSEDGIDELVARASVLVEPFRAEVVEKIAGYSMVEPPAPQSPAAPESDPLVSAPALPPESPAPAPESRASPSEAPAPAPESVAPGPSRRAASCGCTSGSPAPAPCRIDHAPAGRAQEWSDAPDVCFDDLSDLVSGSVFFESLEQLLASWCALETLERAGKVEIRQVRNRLRGASSGSRTISVGLIFCGHPCRVKLISAVHDTLQPETDVLCRCRRLGLLSDPQSYSTSVVALPFRMRVGVGLLRVLSANFAGLIALWYLILTTFAPGTIGEDTRVPSLIWSFACAFPYFTLAFMLWRNFFASVRRAVSCVVVALPIMLNAIVVRFSFDGTLSYGFALGCAIILPASLCAATSLWCERCHNRNLNGSSNSDSASKPSRVSRIYQKMFGMDGSMWISKMLVVNFNMVATQSFFKLPVLGRAAWMAGSGNYPKCAFAHVLTLNSRAHTVPVLHLRPS